MGADRPVPGCLVLSARRRPRRGSFSLVAAAERPIGSAGRFPEPDTTGLLSHRNTRRELDAGQMAEGHRGTALSQNGYEPVNYGARREKGSRTVRFGGSVRGKSGLHRARCRVTPGRREATESVTENRPPMAASVAQARVKRWGKSPPRAPATAAARQTPPGARPSRSERRPAAFELRVGCTRRRVTGVPER